MERSAWAEAGSVFISPPSMLYVNVFIGSFNLIRTLVPSNFALTPMGPQLPLGLAGSLMSQRPKYWMPGASTALPPAPPDPVVPPVPALVLEPLVALPPSEAADPDAPPAGSVALEGPSPEHDIRSPIEKTATREAVFIVMCMGERLWTGSLFNSRGGLRRPWP